MGIKGLNYIIKNHVKSPFQERDIEYFSGSKFGIDSGILFYKCAYKRNISGESIVTGFLNKAIWYLENNIIPIFCFDGTPPEEKNSVIKSRWTRKEKIKAKLQELGDSNPELSLRLQRQIICVSKEEKKQVIEIIKLSGLPWVISSGEAEGTCALLQKEGHTDFTVTEDGDALMFGCPSFIKDSTTFGKVKHYDLGHILQELNLSFQEFLDLAILCGCDYCPTIQGIGPAKSLKLVKENGLFSQEILNCTEEYWNSFTVAKRLYTKPVLAEDSNLNLELPQPTLTQHLKEIGIPNKTISKLIFRLNAAIGFQK